MRLLDLSLRGAVDLAQLLAVEAVLQRSDDFFLGAGTVQRLCDP